LQGQNLRDLQSALRSLEYEPGGRGQVDLDGALREARTSQLTTDRGARLGVANMALILTSTTEPLSRQVRHQRDAIVFLFL